MRRSRRIRPAEAPRVVLSGIIQVARLFGARYARSEGAHVLVRDPQGRILVVRTTYLGPGWMLPGGRVERDEAPHVAAERETREETGLEVRVTRLLAVDAHKPHDTSFVFAAEAVGGELDPQLGEIAEVGWLAPGEIAESSPRLHRLLMLIERAEGGVAYLGLDRPVEAGSP